MIIGCAALHPFQRDNSAEKYAELACVVVHPEYRQGSRGDYLLSHVEQLAREKGMKAVYVMTTQTEHWFIERGFKEIAGDQLPDEIRTKQNPQRQSKVFIKLL